MLCLSKLRSHIITFISRTKPTKVIMPHCSIDIYCHWTMKTNDLFHVFFCFAEEEGIKSRILKFRAEDLGPAWKRAVFKRLTKSQWQSNNFDQSQQEQTVWWTNHNPWKIGLFSLYVLFSHFRPRDATRGNSFFQMSSYVRITIVSSPSTNYGITNEKKQKENSHESITWSEIGKQNVQAKEVYWL